MHENLDLTIRNLKLGRFQFAAARAATLRTSIKSIRS
jgi:hypothetical protein